MRKFVSTVGAEVVMNRVTFLFQNTFAQSYVQAGNITLTLLAYVVFRYIFCELLKYLHGYNKFD